MYNFYNANPIGKFENDCTIRAISAATGNSWDYVYDYLSDVAQSKGTMQDDRKFIIDFLDENFERVPSYHLTVGDVSCKYKNHIVLITMKGHITCSKYGRIYDTFNPSNRLAEYVWIVE